MQPPKKAHMQGELQDVLEATLMLQLLALRQFMQVAHPIPASHVSLCCANVHLDSADATSRHQLNHFPAIGSAA